MNKSDISIGGKFHHKGKIYTVAKYKPEDEDCKGCDCDDPCPPYICWKQDRADGQDVIFIQVGVEHPI